MPQAAEYKINDLERSTENIQIGTHQDKKNKNKNTEKNIRSTWDRENTSISNICVTEHPKEKK